MTGPVAVPTRIVVTVGTDHHPFERLTSWLEDWLPGHDGVECLHQHGSSRPAAGAEAVALLPRSDLLARQRTASVVVAQGGPGSIMDARSCGRVPIVVPRRPELGEVVDDHQVAFSRRLADLGWIRLAEGRDAFAAEMDAAVGDPGRLTIDPPASAGAATAAALSAQLVALSAQRPGLLDVRRLRFVAASLRR